MGRHPAESYPWNQNDKDVENDSFSRLSFGSLSRSTSEGSSSATPDSPRAIDPEDIESQVSCGLEKHLLEEANNNSFSESS